MSSHIERFAFAQLPITPWKNGGGVTREIARMPGESDMDSFDWRASIADVSMDGAFSTFPGVDRVIVLLQGAGVLLRSRDGTLDHSLDTPLVPYAFSADIGLDATLIHGPSRDFNVMTRRSAARADVRVIDRGEMVADAPSGVLFAARGGWRLSSDGGHEETLEPESGLWWNDEPLAWTPRPQGAGGALIAVRIVGHAQNAKPNRPL